jgi:protein phosphatase PTC7
MRLTQLANQKKDSVLSKAFHSLFKNKKMSIFPYMAEESRGTNMATITGTTAAATAIATTTSTTTSSTTTSISSDGAGSSVITFTEESTTSLTTESIDGSHALMFSSQQSSNQDSIEPDQPKLQTSTTAKHYDMIVGKGYIPKRCALLGNFTNILSHPPELLHIMSDFGEDAFFSSCTSDHSCMGVADGVGGWNSMGINPSLFAWALMDNCKYYSETMSPPMPWNVLQEAYDTVVNSGEIEAGSSTACLVALDRKNGVLHGANLGDSGFVVFRFNREIANVTPSGRRRSGSEGDLKQHITTNYFSSLSADNYEDAHYQYLDEQSPLLEVVHESKENQHYFNAPYQLALLPQGLSDAQKRLFMSDPPERANRSSFGPLMNGDLIVMCTDGVFDNMFMDDIIQIIMEELEDLFMDGSVFTTLPSQNEEEFRQVIQDRIQRTTERLVSEAARFSLSKRQSPFALESRLQRMPDSFYEGGKVDDATVLCAMVISKENTPEDDTKENGNQESPNNNTNNMNIDNNGDLVVEK